MANPLERRSCRRILVGPEHAVRFQTKGHSFQNVQITNISATGCFIMVSQRDAALFLQGTFLENFAFEHPELALRPLSAKVMYTLGGASPVAILEFMGVGLHFVGMDDASLRLLEAFLAVRP